MKVQVGHPSFVTDAMVLRLRDYGDSDRIVTLLTLDYGKVTAIAKGAKRSRKRFGGALCPFGYGSALLKERPGRELWVLEEFQSVSGFSSIPLEMGRFAQASYACELIQELVPMGHPEPNLFYQLRSFLAQLNDLPLSSKPPVHTLFSFELATLRHAGWQLSLTSCARCGVVVSSSVEDSYVGVDVHRGGILCKDCYTSQQQQGLRGISHATWEALVLFERQSHFIEGGVLEEVPPFSRETLSTCRDMLLSVIEHYVGKNLRTVSFIRQMNGTSF